MASEFEIIARCGQARLGRLSTPHGAVESPAFMPVGTAGSVKALSPDDLRDLGAGMVLANTYHLMLRPGAPTVRSLGGLHRFMAWDGPILTDSGGFQVFSLARLRELSDEGVTFRSHLDGSEYRLSPEKAVAIQEDLGADVIMCLDECPAFPAGREEMERAVRRTTLWARRCREAHRRPDQALFGIAQGGVFPDLRAESIRDLVDLDFPGYALGGLSVGEPKAEMYRILEFSAPLLPWEKPRYLMGVGAPEDLVEGVFRGVDMFDCVLPTRNARNGQALTAAGEINIRNAALAQDQGPLEQGCACYTCRTFSRGYLRHLYLARELLVYRLLTIHNLHYILGLMAGLRRAVAQGKLAAFREDFQARRGGRDSTIDRTGVDAAA